MRVASNKRSPGGQTGARVISMLCANDLTPAYLQVQLLVDRHRVHPGFAALVAALAYGEAAR